MKYINTENLIKLNQKAVATNRNQALSDDLIGQLDPDGKHVVTLSFVHNDVEMRTMLFIKVLGSTLPVTALLDVSFEDFKNTFSEVSLEELSS